MPSKIRKPTGKATERTKPSKKAAQSEGGKGKPPKHAQFRKGKSGNPFGRPKGIKNLATIIREAAEAPVTATIDGKPRRISKLMANVWQLATKGAAGDNRSAEKFIKIVEDMERRDSQRRPSEFPFGPEDLEVLNAVYERLKLCEPSSAFE